MKTVVALLAIYIWSPSLAHAGESMGNGGRGGGGAIVCYKIQKTRDLVQRDLESDRAEIDLHLNPDELTAPPVVVDYLETLVTQANRQLDPVNWGNHIDLSNFEEEINKVYMFLWDEYYHKLKNERPDFWELFNRTRTSPRNWRPTTNRVPLIKDIEMKTPIPRNCLYMQAAFFDDSSRTVIVNLPLYRLLDTRNRAALWMHEDLTHYYREGIKQCELTVKNIEEIFYTAKLGQLRNSQRSPRSPEKGWCNIPTPNSTNAARDFGVLLLSKPSSRPSDSWKGDDEFNYFAGRISLSVEFGDNFIMSIEGKNWFHAIDGDGLVGTHLIRKFNRQRIARINPSAIIVTGWELRLRGLLVDFPSRTAHD